MFKQIIGNRPNVITNNLISNLINGFFHFVLSKNLIMTTNDFTDNLTLEFSDEIIESPYPLISLKNAKKCIMKKYDCEGLEQLIAQANSIRELDKLAGIIAENNMRRLGKSYDTLVKEIKETIRNARKIRTQYIAGIYDHPIHSRYL